MKLIVIAVLFGFLLITALGIRILKLIHAPLSGYSAPAGLAFFFALLQIGYYPVQILNGPFRFVFLWTTVILLYGIYCLFREWKSVWKELIRPKTLWILAGVCAFLAVFYLCYIDLEYSDSPMYLNYISQNIGIDHLNLFNLYTGKAGQEWDALYLYQGYYHFVSCFVTYLNLPARFGIGHPVETLKASVWGMGLLYSFVSGALIVNIADALNISSRRYQAVLTAFALFYLNLYYWRVVFAFYGNTYRSLFLTFLMFMIWKKEQDNETEGYRILLPAIVAAGLASSSSFLFVSFAALSIYAAYLFLSARKGSLFEMSITVLPLAVYACVLISRTSKAGWILSIFFLLYYAFCRTAFVQKLLDTVEGFLIRYAKPIFVFLLPGLCMAFALYIHFFKPEFLYGYSYYFQNHQNYDMVKDYFFVYSTWYDNLINVLRWAGLIVFLFKARKAEEWYIKVTVLGMALVFMNPLATPTVAYFIASNVFYRAWEVLFNPFTELLFLACLGDFLKPKHGMAVISVILLGVTVVSNTLALRGDKSAAYGFYIAGADENYNRINKVDRYGEEGIHMLEEAIQSDGITDRQPVVISQAEGTRVYLPYVYQLVTARDEYYIDTRVNEDLYQIGKRHHPWEEDTADYAKTCSLVKEYGVDYVLERYWENGAFDEALNACSVDVWQNSYFRLKKIQ